MNISLLKSKLKKCYSKDLCYPKIAQNWSEDNKAYGMCAITALIVNDYFGGDLGKIYVGDISHYFNVLNNKIVDLTSSQFEYTIDYSDYIVVSREKMLSDRNTRTRYLILKQKLEQS